MNSHDAELLDIARFALKRHGTPEKALAGFADKIWNNAPLLRTVIGADAIKAAALKYLHSVPAQAGGGVRAQSESHQGGGLADTSEGGAVRRTCESQKRSGPSSPDPSIVPVVAHNRGKPGNARRGLAEVAAIAARNPAIFTVKLSDGRDFKQLHGWEVRRIVPNTSFDFAMSVQAQRYARFDDAAIMGDVLPDDMLRTHEDKAKRFSALVAAGVEITFQAFEAMDAHHIEASNAAA